MYYINSYVKDTVTMTEHFQNIFMSVYARTYTLFCN